MKKSFLLIFLLCTTNISAISFNFSFLKRLKCAILPYFSTIVHPKSSQRLKNIEKKLKKIEKFLKIGPYEVHTSDICLETLYEEIKKLTKDLNKIAINSWTIKRVKELAKHLEKVKEKIGKLEQQYFVGMRQGEYASYSVLEEQYKTNFATPLEKKDQSLDQFIQEGGVYHFLGFDQIPDNNVGFDKVNAALVRKKQRVDKAAQTKENKNHELTLDQWFCRQIEFVLSDPTSEQLCRAFHRGQQEVEVCIPDAQTQQKRQETYLQNNLTAGECKLAVVDLIYGIKSNIDRSKATQKRDQEEWEFVPKTYLPSQQEVDDFVLINSPETVC